METVLAEESLSGPNIALLGPAGTGKTDSLGTLCDAGLEVFYLDLENGLESLLKHFTRQNKPIPANLHWHKIAPPKRDFKVFASAIDKVLKTSFKVLSEYEDPDRSKYDAFYKLVSALGNFHDDRTDKDFGSVHEWEPTRVLAIDGLTGISSAAMSTVTGGKPVRSQRDWGVAQDMVETLLRMICDNCKCWFVLLGHVEMEPDIITGGMKIMAATLGKKLAPKIAPMFSDVVLTKRAETRWTWDTLDPSADLKARNLPWASNQQQTFAPIVAEWQKRHEAIKKARLEAEAALAQGIENAIPPSAT